MHLVITPETVSSALARHLPIWKGASVTHLGGGLRWEVYKVQDKRGEMLTVRVRVPAHGETASLRDWLIGLNARWNTRPMIGDYTPTLWFEVYPYVEGLTPASEGVRLHVYLSSLVEQLRRLHRELIYPLGAARAFTTQWWIDLMVNLSEDCIPYLHDHEILLGDVMAQADRMIGYGLDSVYPVQTSILHGDLSPHNVLISLDDPTEVTGLIDWDDAHLGDYMWDLAGLACFHDEGDPELPTQILILCHGLEGGESIHPKLLTRFWTYYLIHAATRLAAHHRRDPKMDLTRGVARVGMASEQLTVLV